MEGCRDGEMNGRKDAAGLGRELTTVEDPAASVQEPATRDDAKTLVHGAEAVPEDLCGCAFRTESNLVFEEAGKPWPEPFLINICSCLYLRKSLNRIYGLSITLRSCSHPECLAAI